MLCDHCGCDYDKFKKYTVFDLCEDCYGIERKKRGHKLRCNRYGITVEFFDLKLQEQNSKCACCNKPFEDWADIVIEHCHKTGKVRGLCCRSCNNLMGGYHDNIEFMKERIKSLHMAIEYLSKFNNGL